MEAQIVSKRYFSALLEGYVTKNEEENHICESNFFLRQHKPSLKTFRSTMKFKVKNYGKGFGMKPLNSRKFHSELKTALSENRQVILEILNHSLLSLFEWFTSIPHRPFTTLYYLLIFYSVFCLHLYIVRYCSTIVP